MKTRKIFKKYQLTMLFALLLGVFGSCSSEKPEQTQTPEEPVESAAPQAESLDPMQDKGVGPITSVEIGPIDKELVQKGKEVFESKCAACHKFDSKYVGPGLAGVTTRRTPEWIMNMILNPVEMTEKDPLAKQLLEEHLTQMTFQDVTQEDARAILEYFRSVDETAK